MKSAFRLVLVFALAAIGIWLWTILFPSPEKVVTSRLEKLANAATVRPGEGILPRLAGAQKAGDFFATTVDINIDVPRYREHRTLSRDDIVQILAGAKATGGLTVKFQDINVSVDAAKGTAQADVTVEARVPGDQDMMIQQMKITLQKIDGQWLITRVQTVRPLS